jgi:DNA-binding transcriptional MocR family regulator
VEALSLCIKATTKPGDAVAIESPTYFAIFQLMESHGLKVVEIPTDPVIGMDIEYLTQAIPRFDIKACLVVSNFNNPLGSCMPDERKKQLVEMLAKKDIPLIEDDIYGELYFGKTRPKTCKTFDKKGLVLHCASFSKSLAPGYRIGWTIPGRFKDAIIRLKRMHTVSTNTLAQAAVADFLSIDDLSCIFATFERHCIPNRYVTYNLYVNTFLRIRYQPTARRIYAVDRNE